MTNVIFCGYRDWALDIFSHFKKNTSINVLSVVTNKAQFEEEIPRYKPDEVDVIVFCGWSWIIKKEIYERYLCVGIHPSDLPSYRGGSPLQHQIIDGVKLTNISLISLGSGAVDTGDVWMKERISLEGDSMQDVFKNLAKSSIKLLDDFFTVFPNLTPQAQNLGDGFSRMRRHPEDSRLTQEMLEQWPLEKIYDFIRSLTDPYPNAYLEDENGNKLLFTGVKYVKK